VDDDRRREVELIVFVGVLIDSGVRIRTIARRPIGR